MSGVTDVLRMFETQVRERVSQLAGGLCGATPDGHGNYLMLDLPWPANPARCRLGAFYSPRDCLEVSFAISETRGPAERQIHAGNDAANMVSQTVDFLRDIVSGRVVVDVTRYRWLWFQPYHLAFFRDSSSSAGRNVVETLRWSDSSR
jgi:hypothetical protein